MNSGIVTEKFQKSLVLHTGADCVFVVAALANWNDERVEEYRTLPLASYVSAATYQPTEGAYHWTS